ncbi:MAG TPA: hypothetical protein VFJ85_08820 [Acidimicrobiales bacterium]|nr:hypothetical protein [Acidimicrobiales bacterium]
MRTAPAEAVAAYEQLVQRLHHRWNRNTFGLRAVGYHAIRGETAKAREVLRSTSLDCRTLLADCISDQPGTGRLSRWTRLELARGRIAFALPLQAARALHIVEQAQMLLHHRGRFTESYEVGRRLWRTRRAAFVAWNCACSLCRAGDEERALEWLETAIRHGYPAAAVARDPDLAPLVGHPRLVALASVDGAGTDEPAGTVIGPYLAE